MLAQGFDGPFVLIDGEPTAEDLILAARLTARFGSGREAAEVMVIAEDSRKTISKMLRVQPFPAEEIPQDCYV